MRILLVEDDRVLADALSRALVQSAHAVDVVSTGEEADHALAPGTYDLAILDIGLPGSQRC
jgi:two-component system OmpR family response regulator